MAAKKYPPEKGTVLKSTFLEKEYVVHEPLNAEPGMVGSVFHGVDAATGERVVIKVPRVSGIDLGAYALGERLTRVGVSFGDEFNAAERLRSNLSLEKAVGLAIDAGEYRADIQVSEDEERPFRMPFNVIRYVDGVDLAEWCKRQGGQNSFTGIKDVTTWFKMCRQITEIVASIHSERVVHGDIWERNIMVSFYEGESRPVLIDFGKSWRQEDMQFRDGTEKKRHGYMAPELLTSTWTSQADLYSMGGVFFFLATGESPPYQQRDGENDAVSEDVASFKDEIKKKISHRNPGLLAQNRGVFEVIWFCMDPRTELRAPLALSVIDLIDRFAGAVPKDAEEMLLQLQNGLYGLSHVDKLNAVAARPVFAALAHRAIQKLARNIKCAASRLYTVRGSPEEMRDAILLALGTLKNHDSCRAILTVPFFLDEGIGAGSQLISMLQMVARNGVSIKWLLILSETESKNQVAEEVVTRWAEAAKETENFYIQFRVVSDEERTEMLRAPKSCIYLEDNTCSKPPRAMLITPYYSYPSLGSKPGFHCIGDQSFHARPIALRFWSEPDRWRTELRGFFESHWERSYAKPDEALIYASGHASLGEHLN